MKIGGVIAEYNPFHKGHEYQLDQMRRSGVDRIVAVMSGNFVQRGDAAVLNKFARARAAAMCGADLVVELPTLYALSSAERFAWGGIFLLQALGCVHALSFGCEHSSIRELKELASAVDSAPIHPLIRTALKKGISYPAARMEAVEKLLGPETAVLLKQPNNILAVEYLKACQRLGAEWEIIPVQRKGAAHDGKQESEGMVSASELRRRIITGESSPEPFMPAPSFGILQHELEQKRAPARLSELERTLIYQLRSMTPEELERLPDVREGLENRIAGAIRSSRSLEELLNAIQCKRYSMSRIRRIVLCAFLGITKGDFDFPPPYIRVLACTPGGLDILKAARETAALPILTRASDVRKLDGSARIFWERELRFDSLYALSTPEILGFPYGAEPSRNGRIIE